MAESQWIHKSTEQIEEFKKHHSSYKYIIISQKDKDYIRSEILSLLSSNLDNITVAKQLQKTIQTIVQLDFPKNWGNLALQVKEYVESEDENKLYAGLCGLKSICKHYEYEFEEHRNPLHEIADMLFPTIEGIFEKLMDNR